jgi:hypothetical protein
MIGPQDEAEFKTRCDALAATLERWQKTPTCDDLVAILLIIAGDPDLAQAFQENAHQYAVAALHPSLPNQAAPEPPLSTGPPPAPCTSAPLPSLQPSFPSTA